MTLQQILDEIEEQEMTEDFAEIVKEMFEDARKRT